MSTSSLGYVVNAKIETKTMRTEISNLKCNQNDTITNADAKRIFFELDRLSRKRSSLMINYVSLILHSQYAEKGTTFADKRSNAQKNAQYCLC